MLIDRPNVVEGTSIQNATVPSGTTAPLASNEGELFVFQDGTATGAAGLHVFLGGGWEIVPAGISIQDVDAHIANQSLHLSAAQNTLLDGLASTLTAAELNFVDGVTSPIQAQFTSQTSALNTHAADTALHLSTAQNTLLDGLAPTLTAAELNFVDGVTSPIQAQFDSVSGASSSHFTDTALHLSANQNTFADALNFVAETPAQKAASVNGLSVHLASTALHLSTAQNTFLDALNLPSLTAADVNRISGLDAYLTSSGQSNLSIALASKLSRNGDTMASNANLVFVGGTVTGLPFPTADSDAANKAYVDAMGSGVDWKEPVVAATTGPISLSGAPTLVDDAVVNANDRVLVKNQVDPTQNGIYLAAAGAWSRAPDYDTAVKISQSSVYVLEGGSASGGGSYIQPAVIASFPGEAIEFFPFTGPAVNSAGNGIELGVNGTVSIKQARGITFDGADNVEADIFAGHLIFTTDGATISSLPSAQIGLANTGITAGTYRSITVDTKGRATAGTNPTTIAGYGLTDAQPLAANLTGLAAVATFGLSVRTAVGIWTSRSILSTDLTLTNADGVAGNITINLPSVGTPGTYRSVTTDAKGRVTAGTNPTTLAGYGITDAQPLNTRLTDITQISTQGFLVKLDNDIFTRFFVATGAGLSINEAYGATGNPTIVLNSTSAPTGNTVVYRDFVGSTKFNAVQVNSVSHKTGSTSVSQSSVYQTTLTGSAGLKVIQILPDISGQFGKKYIYAIKDANSVVQMGEILVLLRVGFSQITEYATLFTSGRVADFSIASVFDSVNSIYTYELRANFLQSIPSGNYEFSAHIISLTPTFATDGA